MTQSSISHQKAKAKHNEFISRLPIVDEKAPREVDFDAMLAKMREEDPDTACIFNCQMGKGRTTTGMILACLLKDVLYGNHKNLKAFPKPEKVDPKKFEDEDEALVEARY